MRICCYISATVLVIIPKTTATSLDQSNIVIPLSPSVEVSVTGVSPSEQRLALSFGEKSRFVKSTGSDATTGIGMIDMTIGNVTISVEENMYSVRHSSSLGRLAMGPGSPLLAHFGSVSVIQDATRPVSLLLRSSQENFENFCLGEIISTSPNSGLIGGRIGFADEPATPPTESDFISFPKRTFEMEDAAVMLNSELYTSVISRFPLVFSAGGRFLDCTHIPSDLDLVLYTSPNPDGSGGGQIVIPASSYISRDPSTNICKVSHSWSTVTYFNPLKLSGMNVRLSKSDATDDDIVQLCHTSL